MPFSCGLKPTLQTPISSIDQRVGLCRNGIDARRRRWLASGLARLDAKEHNADQHDQADSENQGELGIVGHGGRPLDGSRNDLANLQLCALLTNAAYRLEGK